MLCNTYRVLSFVFALVTFLYGCKKDEDALAPLVDIVTPYDNQSFAVYDTMSISAGVSDDIKLQSLYMVLVNDQLIPVEAAVNISISNKDMSFVQPYIIDNVHLVSGIYYIKVSASDGVNETNVYRKIYITAAPRQRKGFYLISGSQAATSVYFMDNGFSIAPKLTLGGDYSAAAINSYYQDLYVAGIYTGNFNGIDLESHMIKWTKQGTAGSAPDFTSVYNDGNYTYVSYYNGFIKGYDQNGTEKYSSALAQNFYPVKTFHHGDYILSEQKDISSAARNLVLYYAVNGNGFQQTALGQDVVEFFTKDADNIFVFGNNAGLGIMQLYSISGNGLWSPHAMPAAKLLSAAQVDSNTYLLGFDDNTVYRYTYFNNSLVAWLNNVKATDIFYDAVNNEVIIAEDTKISSYAYTSGGLLNTVMHTDTIKDFEVLYNK